MTGSPLLPLVIRAEGGVMKLDRNINDDGMGKYALILMRRLSECETGAIFGPRWTHKVQQAIVTLEKVGALDWGTAGTDAEFFLIRLKDRHAAAALSAYARSAEEQGEHEWAAEVRALATVAAMHPNKKQPD